MTDPNSAAAAPATPPDAGEATLTHGGAHAVAAARRHGVTAMFTLSGGHVFPLYDGAVKADPPMRLVDLLQAAGSPPVVRCPPAEHHHG